MLQIANWHRRLPLIAIVIIAIFGAVLLREYLSFDALFAHRNTLLAYRDSHYMWASLAFVAIYILLVAFSVPGAIWVTLTGGFLFGLFPGVIYNVIGSTTGAILVFMAARAGIGAEVDAKIKSTGGLAARMRRALAENEVSALLTMRLVPGMPFFLVNLIPAFVGTTLRRFAWTTALGMIPGTFVFTSVGAGLEHIFATGGRPDLGIIFSWPILLPLLALAALSMLPMVYRYFRKGA